MAAVRDVWRSARLAFEVPDSAKNLCAVMKFSAASNSEILSQ